MRREKGWGYPGMTCPFDVLLRLSKDQLLAYLAFRCFQGKKICINLLNYIE
jgi:hypothetical protein